MSQFARRAGSMHYMPGLLTYGWRRLRALPTSAGANGMRLTMRAA